MRKRKNRAARRAAKFTAAVAAKPVTTSHNTVDVHVRHHPGGLLRRAMTGLKRMMSHWSALVGTTLTFAGLLVITLASDQYLFAYLFGQFGAHADPVLVYLFKAAKYLLVLLELWHYVYGVHLECKRHNEQH